MTSPLPDQNLPRLDAANVVLASEDVACDVCGRTMPRLRSGAIECHHDGTYTTLTSLSDTVTLSTLRERVSRLEGLESSVRILLSEVANGRASMPRTSLVSLRAFIDDKQPK